MIDYGCLIGKRGDGFGWLALLLPCSLSVRAILELELGFQLLYVFWQMRIMDGNPVEHFRIAF